MPVSTVSVLPGNTVSLREVALHLGDRAHPNIERTLNELRAGNLEAGFHERTMLSWISLPAQYWADVSTVDLENLRKSSASGKTGVYSIKPRDVGDQVAKVFVDAMKQKNVPISAEIMLSFHREMSVRYDVVVPAASWETFRAANNIQSPQTKSSRQGSGRREDPSWRQIATFATAAVLSQISEPERIKQTALVAAINELAVKNNSAIVGESALRQLVSEAFKLRRSASN